MLKFETLERRDMLSTYMELWHNYDVNENCRVDAADVLNIVNYLNTEKPPNTNFLSKMDINIDGNVTPLDALILINEINKNGERNIIQFPQYNLVELPVYAGRRFAVGKFEYLNRCVATHNINLGIKLNGEFVNPVDLNLQLILNNVFVQLDKERSTDEIGVFQTINVKSPNIVLIIADIPLSYRGGQFELWISECLPTNKASIITIIR